MNQTGIAFGVTKNPENTIKKINLLSKKKKNEEKKEGEKPDRGINNGETTAGPIVTDGTSPPII